ncbi:iron-containing alcohol dehydrogenase [Consotaella aegiceratis]|uniref:iron-containing alcohol dehydrogenase n=1 Tax=Consotaella aegiceratis TaxID=3097961 RepID=UPI002F3FDA6A
MAARTGLTLPQRVEFGVGCVGTAGAWARATGARRPLVLADIFNAARVDCLDLPGEPAVFDDVRSEPELADLEAAIAFARSVEPDLIVGFGGGSAMDLAKLVAVTMASSKSVLDIVGPNKADPRSVGLIQVTTTAGTGSEIGTRALVTEPVSGDKLAVESPHMLADLAVIDPGLTVSVPAATTAATGVDALAHCVEAFTSKRAHPLIDMFAREGIRLAGQHLRRAVECGEDVEARAAMSMAAFCGGVCLGPVNTTAGHAISYPLGTRQKLAHGIANALIFPHTLAFNEPVCEAKTDEVRRLLGLAGGDLAAVARDFCSSLGIAMRLRDHGVAEQSLDAMATEAGRIRRLLDHNPRPIGRDEILAIYQAAY